MPNPRTGATSDRTVSASSRRVISDYRLRSFKKQFVSARNGARLANGARRYFTFEVALFCSPLQFTSEKANAAHEILEPRVGPQRIENRMQQDRSFEARIIGLVQPHHRLVPIAQSNID